MSNNEKWVAIVYPYSEKDGREEQADEYSCDDWERYPTAYESGYMKVVDPRFFDTRKEAQLCADLIAADMKKNRLKAEFAKKYKYCAIVYHDHRTGEPDSGLNVDACPMLTEDAAKCRPSQSAYLDVVSDVWYDSRDEAIQAAIEIRTVMQRVYDNKNRVVWTITEQFVKSFQSVYDHLEKKFNYIKDGIDEINEAIANSEDPEPDITHAYERLDDMYRELGQFIAENYEDIKIEYRKPLVLGRDSVKGMMGAWLDRENMP